MSQIYIYGTSLCLIPVCFKIKYYLF